MDDLNKIKYLSGLVESAGSLPSSESVQLHDSFDLELNKDFVIESNVAGFTEDGILVHVDETAFDILEMNDLLVDDQLHENKLVLASIALIAALWGVSEYQAHQIYKQSPQLQTLTQFYEKAKQEGDSVKAKEIKKRISNHKTRLRLGKGEVRDADGNPIEPVYEAEYQGRKVTLNKPMQGDVKKFKVYVKDPKTGNVKKVNFGDPDMRIRKSNPEARKSFRARHKCDQKKDKTTAGYWSCRMW